MPPNFLMIQLLGAGNAGLVALVFEMAPENHDESCFRLTCLRYASSAAERSPCSSLKMPIIWKHPSASSSFTSFCNTFSAPFRPFSRTSMLANDEKQGALPGARRVPSRKTFSAPMVSPYSSSMSPRKLNNEPRSARLPSFGKFLIPFRRTLSTP